MFAELMAHGDEEERAAANEEDLSPLFMGGMEHRIHSVVALNCALNGNSVFDMLADPDFDLNSVKVPWWSRYFGKRMSDKIQVQTDGRDFRDCGDYDMQIDQYTGMTKGGTKINKGWKENEENFGLANPLY